MIFLLGSCKGLYLVDTIANGEEVNQYEQQGSIRTTINDGQHEVLLVDTFA
jgi:hypothetical protein